MSSEPLSAEAASCAVCGRDLRKRFHCEQCPAVVCSGACLQEHVKVHPRGRTDSCGAFALAGIVVGALLLIMLVGAFFVCCGGCSYLVGKVPSNANAPAK